MQYLNPKFSAIFLLVLPVAACEMGTVGDAEQNSGIPMHEVYLESPDGQQTTLGYYDAEGSIFYESATLDLPRKSVFIEMENDDLALFPEFGVENEEVELDLSATYPVYTYADQASEDTTEWEWERVDLGTARIAPHASSRSIDIEATWRDVNHASKVGTAVAENCLWVPTRVGRNAYYCTVLVYDNKAQNDGFCTGVFMTRGRSNLKDHIVTSCDSVGNKNRNVFAGFGDRPYLTAYVCPVKDLKKGPGRNWSCIKKIKDSNKDTWWFEVQPEQR